MQNADTLLMIEPIAFGFNEQTAENNYFQQDSENGDSQEKALSEFKNLVQKLVSHGIEVISVKDTLKPHTPDSIFPNNWVSFGEDGTVVLYPMFAENRRWERRAEILEEIRNRGFDISAVEDLSVSEKDGKFLEGTGSMIFDHDNKIAYGSVSERLDEVLFRKFCEEKGFEAVVFHSFQTVEHERLPIYHTNVMMSVGDHFVVICLDSVDDEMEREKLVEVIKLSGKELIEISEEQLQHFAGNMLQVQNKNGEKFLVMSTRAFQSLTSEQIEKLEKYSTLLYSDLRTIENLGGGSARCMLAEVFLPKV